MLFSSMHGLDTENPPVISVVPAALSWVFFSFPLLFIPLHFQSSIGITLGISECSVWGYHLNALKTYDLRIIVDSNLEL